MARRHGVELGEDRLLDLHLLGRRFDHEVDVAEVGVVGGAGDSAHHDLELLVGLLLRQLLLLDEAIKLALGHFPRLVEPVVHELLLDVLEDDGDLGGCDRLRDLATHGSGADDGGLENEHLEVAPFESWERDARGY